MKFSQVLYNAQQGHRVFTDAWTHAKPLLLAGHRLIVEVKTETRSLAQNRRMWAMLRDLSAQVDWYGHYPALGAWWVQLWEGSGDDARVVARAYGDSPEQAMQRAEQIAAALSSAPAREQWQPIETAPKDGTLVALRRNQQVRSGRWGKGTYNTGWLSDDSDVVFAFSSINPPTHWMPLPSAPGATAEPAPVREPMSLEQRRDGYHAARSGEPGSLRIWGNVEFYYQGIQDAERHHGITKE